ncbi:MAG: hypothetical protein V3573_03075 [Desulfovibrionaceae bacterium]
MNKSVLLAIAAMLFFGLAGLGYAGTMFEGLDTDHDGMLSAEELGKTGADIDAESFKAVDTDQDGGLNHDEWAAGRGQLGFGPGQGMGQGKGMGQGQGMGQGKGMGPRDGTGPAAATGDCNKQ